MQTQISTRLSGKTAFVTAAGQGIGLQVATMFAENGAQVVATDINEELLQRIDHPNITVMQLDVTDRDAVNKSIAAAGSLDVLFNCAGYVHAGTVLECSEEDWDFSENLNVRSMFYTITAVLPGMIDAGGGSIINMSSVVSSMKGVPNRFIYHVTKAAVLGLTKSIATDFIDKGIRCNAICPGTVDSPSLHDRLRATGDYDKAMGDFISRQPLGRFGYTQEIGHLALYLASDESAFTTGHAHAIDGGWAM